MNPNPYHRSVSLNRPIGKSKKLSASSFDDLPEAIREGSRPVAKSKRPPRWAVAGAIVGLLGFLLLVRAIVSATVPTVVNSPAPIVNAQPADDRVLGHYAYKEAPEAELEAVNADGGIRLHKNAAFAYNDMVAAAQADGISLSPLSGFRSVKEQESVFFDVKQARSQTASDRANVSAPPGHSEHHTGYAIDIGDGNAPSVNLSPDFENTAAFKWLETNAVKYSFEMSFPKDNKQGVTYEPWHWRFVGDRTSLETFFKAKEK
jgi:zinc D-Ala-D-Ala carboxypeptidase